MLVVLGSAVYANSLAGPFVFDDRATIVDNTSIETLAPAVVFAPPRETPVAGRPVVNATFALNYALGGRDVTGYHVVNLALHVLCGLLVFGIVRRTLLTQPLAGRFGPRAADLAMAVALLWLVHPLNSEVVDYLSQRTESTMALFFLATVYASIRAGGGDRRGGAWTGIAIAACALGMASKESMVGAPLVVLAWDALFGGRAIGDTLRARWRLYAGLAATWLVLAAVLLSGPRAYSAGFTAHDAAPFAYLLNQAVMITRYLRLAFWPDDLVLYYGWPRALSVSDVWPQLLLVTGLAAATLAGLVRRHPAAFAGFWFFVTLAPTSSIVPIPTEVGAERRMYLALAGVLAVSILAVVGGWDRLRSRTPVAATADASIPRASTPAGVFAFVALAVVVAAFSALTISRNQEYGSSLRLAETTVERWPSPAAHSMLGTELAAAGRLPEAEAQLRMAAPEYPPARYYLGTVLARVGRTGEAIDTLAAFVASQPPELDQVRLARAVLGDALVQAGRIGEATEQFKRMTDMWPADVEAHARLAGLYVRQEQYAAAVPHYEAALRVRAGDPVLLGGLGVALNALGRTDDAVLAFRQAADAAPANARAQLNLARMLATRGRPDDLPEAVTRAGRAATLAPQDPSAHLLLGQVLAAAGRREDARRALERALALDPASPARQVLRSLGYGG